AIASLTVAQPGSAGTGADASASASASDVPGLTRKLAPAATAACTSSAVNTVPTPTTASATSLMIAFMDSSAACVRSVTSITLSPPATSARASGTASATCSIVSTGMTGAWAAIDMTSGGGMLSPL